MSEDHQEHTLVSCSTSAGDFTLQLNKEWSPLGYERAVTLLSQGFYDNSHFYRVVPHFLVQFGISYSTNPTLQQLAHTTIPDDPPLQPRIPFDEGFVSFAGSGPNSRTCQLFIAYGKRESLGTMPWETPIGTVVHGMQTIRDLNHDYGDMPPWGNGPQQHKIQQGGREYVEEYFPHLDRFHRCHVKTVGGGEDGVGVPAEDGDENENELEHKHPPEELQDQAEEGGGTGTDDGNDPMMQEDIQKDENQEEELQQQIRNKIRRRIQGATDIAKDNGGTANLIKDQPEDEAEAVEISLTVTITTACVFFLLLFVYGMKKRRRKVSSKSI